MPLKLQLGGANPYAKLNAFQLAKRARRGDAGAVMELERRRDRKSTWDEVKAKDKLKTEGPC